MNTIHLLAVSYFGSNDSEQLYKSLLLQDHENWRLFLVDNSQDSNETLNLERIAQKDKRIEIINTGSNLGYLGAVQYAMRINKEIRNNPLVILNTDIYFTEKSSLKSIIYNLQPGVGIIAPSIKSEWDSKDQNPYKRNRPTIQQLKLRKFFLGKPLIAQLSIYAHSLLRLTRRSEQISNSKELIYAPHGSAFVLSREMIKQLNRTPFPLFLFGEEIFLAELCSTIQQKCVYVPEIKLTHREHKHTGFKRSKEMLNFNATAIDFCIELISQRKRNAVNQ